MFGEVHTECTSLLLLVCVSLYFYVNNSLCLSSSSQSPRRTDRDAIRRRLATGSDGEYCYCDCGYVYGPEAGGYGGSGAKNNTRRFAGGSFVATTDARRKSTSSVGHQHYHRRYHHGLLQQQHRATYHSGVTVDLEMCLINELYNRNVYDGDGDECNYGGSTSTTTSRQGDDRDRGRAVTANYNSNNDVSANDRRQQKNVARRRTLQVQSFSSDHTARGRTELNSSSSIN